jgi:hypothetical protein
MSGLLGNISAMFRPTQQVTQVAGPTPQNPMPQQNPGSDPALLPPNNQPAASGANADPTKTSNPLDNFTEMWKNDPNATPQSDPLSQPLFNTDPAKIREAASKIDFIGQVPQDVLQKATSGDMQAFMQVINFVAQKSLATSAELATATAEQGAVKNNERWNSVLPDRIKQLQLAQQRSDNPVLQHPAAQPILQMAKQQAQMKNPNASPAEIQTLAENYLIQFASTLTAKPAEQGTPASGGGTDWETWASN